MGKEEATKASKLVFIVALLVMFIAPAVAKETPEQILKLLPSMIENFIAEEPTLYDDPGLGASIGYNDISGIALTLYLYDLELGNIEDGVTSEVILKNKEAVINEIKESEYWSNVLVINDTKKELDLGNDKKVPVLFTQFFLESSDQTPGSNLTLRSDLYLLGAKGYICKIRVTRVESTSDKKEEEIKKIIRELFSRLIS